MFESVGFRLFNLAGVESPATHWVHLRIIDEVDENPASQYRGDFWGLYLAVENEDGRFLRQHGLPDGNLYKMEFGDGTLQSHPAGGVTNKSDLKRFMTAYRGGKQPEAWWRENLDLPRYYSYRSILECIHHYDVDEAQAKNYDYFHNPETQRWQVVPWDIDLTWADHMYGNGNESFRNRVLSRPEFRLDYLDRLREIRDLLFNTNQAWALIDECAAFLSGAPGAPVQHYFIEADRAKWDFHPVMAMGGKAGQGLFYQSAETKDFKGMVQGMKDYVVSRGKWVDSVLLRDDANIPATPTVKFVGAGKYPMHGLTFRCAADPGAGTFAAQKWRVAEVSLPNVVNGKIVAPGKYEITPDWESGELKTFSPEVSVPKSAVMAGRSYRVRVRLKDAAGHWSHWSPAVDFVPTQ